MDSWPHALSKMTIKDPSTRCLTNLQCATKHVLKSDVSFIGVASDSRNSFYPLAAEVSDSPFLAVETIPRRDIPQPVRNVCGMQYPDSMSLTNSFLDTMTTARMALRDVFLLPELLPCDTFQIMCSFRNPSHQRTPARAERTKHYHQTYAPFGKPSTLSWLTLQSP
jgi:hypothetical protein